jgi:hypothetical protein
MIGIYTSTGKVIKRKRKNWIALNPLIIHNRRDGHGRVGYDIIHNFKTIRSTDLPQKARAFWLGVELTLQRLIRERKIYAADADKIRRKFARDIPLPVAPTAAPVVKPATNPTVAERLKERFKDLL